MAETVMEYTGTLVVHTCGECGIVFGMERSFYRRKKEDHTVWFCPNGHNRVFMGTTESEKLKKEIEEQQKVIRYKQDRIDNLHNHLTQQKAKTRAEKAAKTRLKNRVTHGGCPCCNRTVKQLAEHMRTEHPEVVNAPEINPIHEKINLKRS